MVVVGAVVVLGVVVVVGAMVVVGAVVVLGVGCPTMFHENCVVVVVVPSVAVMFTTYVPGIVGEPVISPVVTLIDRPGGSPLAV